MDTDRFDALVKSLFVSGTRRRLLSLLTAAPVAGGLTTLLEQEAEANRPGQNRRAHNHRQSGRRKDKRQDQKEDEDAGGPTSYGFSVVFSNEFSSQSSVHIECGKIIFGNECEVWAVFDLGPGENRLFETLQPVFQCWITPPHTHALDFNGIIPLAPPIITVRSPWQCNGGGPEVGRTQLLEKQEYYYQFLAPERHTIGIVRFPDKPGDPVGFQAYLVRLLGY